MRYLLLVLCLLTVPVWAEAGGVASAGKVKVTVRDAWVMDSSSTFVHIVAVPYAAPDHKLVKGQPYLEVTVWCKGQFNTAQLNMGRVDVYAGDGSAYKYSWTKPAATRAVFSGVERKGGLVDLSTRADGARPESGEELGVWDLRFSSLK